MPVSPTAAVLSAQDGLVHRDQLTLVGVTRPMLRRLLGTGLWREVLPSVYVSSGWGLTAGQRLLAACLYAGPDAVLTGRVALQLHGVANLPSDPYVRVLVPHVRQVRSVEFARVHRTRRPDPGAVLTAGLPACSLERAVIDAGRWCRDLPMIRSLVEEVVRGGLTGVETLRRELDRGPAAGSGLVRLALAEVAGALNTLPEAADR